jgi:hypothetical protein
LPGHHSLLDHVSLKRTRALKTLTNHGRFWGDYPRPEVDTTSGPRYGDGSTVQYAGAAFFRRHLPTGYQKWVTVLRKGKAENGRAERIVYTEMTLAVVPGLGPDRAGDPMGVHAILRFAAEATPWLHRASALFAMLVKDP